MRAAWFGLVFGYAAAVSAANDGGPLRDLSWGAAPADNAIAYIPFDIGGSLNDRPNVAALQSDGNLVIGGYATTASGTDNALARITPPHGVLEPGFGTGGRLRLGVTTNGGISGLVIMADGRILYTTLLSDTTFAIGRLLAVDGAPDLMFDFDGRRALAASAFIPLANVLSAPKIVVQPDKKVVIFAGAGQTTPDIKVYAVATRLKEDGSTDTTFGGQGTGYGSYAPANGSSPVAEAFDAVRLSNGQFIVGGIAYHNGGSGVDIITFRLSENGVLDTSYGTDGFGFVAFDQGGSLDDYLTSLAIDSAGRAVVTGNITDINGRPRTAVARLTASGQPDATFGSGGRVVYEVRAAAVWEYSNSVATLPDGRILVGGTSALCACGGQADAGTLTMFAPNGQINRFFGANGTERFGSEFGPDAQNLQASSMVVSGDYVYVTGWANNPIGSNNQDFATARVIVPLFRGGFEAAAPAP